MRDRKTGRGAAGMLCAAGAAATLAAIGVGYLVVGVAGDAVPAHSHTVHAQPGVGHGSDGLPHHRGGMGLGVASIVKFRVPTTAT